MLRLEHRFTGDGILCRYPGCGHEREYHRVRGPRGPRGPRPKRTKESRYLYHEFVGTGPLCERCGLIVEKHSPYSHKVYYIGIDGEGYGRKDHRYVFVGASDALGEKRWQLEVPEGQDRLSTTDCLEFLLGLPQIAKLFSYSFNYDLTMMLRDLDNRSLFYLFRPDQRPGKFGPKAVFWNGYRLNYQGTKFSVRRDGRRAVVWDLFRFYAKKFVGALMDWKVGDQALWDRLSDMKRKREDFDREWRENPQAVKNYCLEECQCIATLATRLVSAHEAAQLPLKSFYGAGSSGAAMLGAMGIREKIRPTPAFMLEPVAAAFAGGRFEHRIIGPIARRVFNRDISSAYPYALTFLPCLVHGTWERTTKRCELEGARAALIHYGLGNSSITSWGPFPFRERDGSISFPIESGGGWVWLAEYLAAERIFPHVQFREAYVYRSDCDCQPFAKVPEYYVLRLKLGKEGPGLVIKLALNSCYGKLAQSLGKAQFNSWIWAGMITSQCRAQVLEMLGLHRDWDNLLGVATDGIFTLEEIQAPAPRETGTGNSGKPLGGWEQKEYAGGVFFARPGIYFPLNPTKSDLDTIRARGVGKGVLFENWSRIVDVWAKDGAKGTVKLANVSRFCGAKTSTSRARKPGITWKDSSPESPDSYVYKRANHSERAYGQWIVMPIEMTFDPMPKRERVEADNVSLRIRRFPKSLESEPYRKAKHAFSSDSLALRSFADIMIEQPDADLSDLSDTFDA